MNKPKDFDEVQEFTGGFETLPVGGYVCRIMKVEETTSKSGKDMVNIYLDIAEGEHKDFYADKYKGDTREGKKWGCIFYQLVYDNEGKTNRGYKTLVTSVEKSNNCKVAWGDGFCNSLKGKLIGAIFGEEEFEYTTGKHAGEIGTSIKCMEIRSVDTIRNGDFKVPALKTITKSVSSNIEPLDESELPF